MPFCAVCGAPVEGRFCGKCGSAAEASQAAASSPGMPPPVASSAGLSENAACALCYALGFITGILFLVIEPYSKNRNVRFHAFQSIFLSVVVIAVHYAIDIVLFTMLHFFSMFFLLSLVNLGFFVLWVYMLAMTFQGKKVVLPIIGPLAEQQVR
jgi:uncharacterized membrane protein